MKKNILVTLLAVVLLMVCLSGCGAAHITSVSIPTEAALEKGGTIRLDVSYGADREDAEAVAKAVENTALIWSSSDENIAAVDENGLVTAVGGGTAEITVSAQDTDLRSTCKIDVCVPVTGIEADNIAINTTRKNVKIDYVLLPNDADPTPVAFAVADESIATVNDGGITVLAAGKTDVAIIAGGIEKIISLTVQQAPEALFVEDVSLTVGGTAEITVDTGFESVDVGNGFTYYSDSEEVATVNKDGVVTAIAAGTATVTVENELGQSCEFAVAVAAPVVRQTAPVQATNAAPSAPTEQPSVSDPTPGPAPALVEATPAPAQTCPTCGLKIGGGCLFNGNHPAPPSGNGSFNSGEIIIGGGVWADPEVIEEPPEPEYGF